jgi:hypothetical protein
LRPLFLNLTEKKNNNLEKTRIKLNQFPCLLECNPSDCKKN